MARWVRSALAIKPDWQTPCSNVNLSNETLVDADFGQYVRKYVENSYLSDGALGFEIVWDSAIVHQESIRRLMAELRPHGCRFTLSGFDGIDPSFAVLKTLAPHFVKISATTINPAAVSEINRRCHTLEIKTIAEHVENGQVLEHLRRTNIDFAQGFEISPVQPL